MGESTVEIPSEHCENQIFDHFAVQWTDLSYKVRKGFFKRQLAVIGGIKNVLAEKQIIKNVNGTIRSGQLTAIMGPSGAGKSTFLECITEIRGTGRTGQIRFHGNTHKINLAYIPQQDAFFGVLTVKESLLFASKLQNSTLVKNKEDYMAFTVFENQERPKLTRQRTIDEKGFHEGIAFNVMSLLGIEDAADVSTKNLSGGQRKRLSIAQELVSKPNILILDEPTSGLDSSSSHQTIEVLQKLTQHKLPMAIVCTIHQPNPMTFNLFNKVFILSVVGKCIYEGQPLDIVDHLKQVDIDCPSYYNPADFIIEVASGEHGMGAIEKLVTINESTPLELMAAFPHSYTLKEVTIQPKFPFFFHFWYLLHRAIILIVRDPLLFTLRLVSHIAIGIFMGWMYGSVGKPGGCPPDMEHGLSFEGINEARNAARDDGKKLIDNFACLFFGVAILQFFSLMPTVMSFPLQMTVFLKEKRNMWYGTGSYFCGLILADTPFQIIFTAMYVTITYIMTQQIQVMWRFETILVVNIFVALIAQCQGLMVGACFPDNLSSAIYVGTLSILPMHLFSGFFVKIDTIPEVLRPVCYCNYMYFALEAAIISIYGFDRCGKNVKERIELLHQVLLGWLGKMMSIVKRELNEEEEYGDYGDDHIKNGTIENINDNEEINGMWTMSETLVDAFMAGVGAGKKDKNGNIISGVMSLFGFTDDGLYNSYVMLIVYVVLFRVFTFLLLRWKAN